jgi:hypothetical protein
MERTSVSLPPYVLDRFAGRRTTFSGRIKRHALRNHRNAYSGVVIPHEYRKPAMQRRIAFRSFHFGAIR